MDLFAGSEPRKFISFHLDKEQTGQPLQEVDQATEQSASDASATVPDKTSTQLNPLEQDTVSTGQNLKSPVDPVEEPMETQAYEQAANSSTGDSNTSFGTVIENLVMDQQSNEPDATAPAQGASEAITDPQDAESRDLTKLLPNNEILLQDSSSSQESCLTYFTRRMEELGAGDSTIPIPGVTILPEKESFGGDLVLTPGTNQPSFGITGTSSQSPVHFLDPDHNFSEVPHKPRDPIRAKKTKVIVDTSGLRERSDSRSSKTEDPPILDDDVFLLEGEKEPTGTGGHSDYTSEAELSVQSGVTSGDQARSTLDDALFLPSKTTKFDLIGTSDSNGLESTAVENAKESRVHQMSSSSRTLVNHYFQQASAFNLPKDHPTISLNSEQMQTILRVVADESARASYAMMEDIVIRASKLSLGRTSVGQKNLPSNTSAGGSVYPSSEGETVPGNPSDREGSYTSGALHSDNNSNSIGYSFERTPPSVVTIKKPPCREKNIEMDPKSNEPQTATESPGAQTLASLKAEALQDQQSTKRKSKAPQRITTTRRRITRACKIMKEEYFEGMAWTRTFVTGPLDPRWNPYKFYCQICKGNVSIYGKGAREILRHYATERHLRKDQRWRYEHLGIEDPITKTIHHQVRGKDGKVLTPYQLELELPKFMTAPLVDIWEKFPFYDEFMAGAQHMTSSSSNRARVQISVLAHYIPTFGDIRALRVLWKDIGVVVNHQALFADFNWGKERITVSISI